MDSQRRKVLISDTRTPKPHESEDFSDAYSNFRSAAQKKRTFPTPYSRPHEEQSSSSSIEYVEPGSAKCSKLNIYDPLIQTTPIRVFVI